MVAYAYARLNLQRLKEQSQWKEYRTPEGKTYYYHAHTKETTWTMPAEYARLQGTRACSFCLTRPL